MDTPFPGLKVKIESSGQIIQYLDSTGTIRRIVNKEVPVTNLEYETKINEEKRTISLLKPEYVPVAIADMKNVMSYGKSSQFIDKKTKSAYNSKLMK
jgi:hypothetical protein